MEGKHLVPSKLCIQYVSKYLQCWTKIILQERLLIRINCMLSKFALNSLWQAEVFVEIWGYKFKLELQ